MTGPEAASDLKSATMRYAMSHFGKALLWVAADNFTLYYFTNIARLRADFAAWLFLGLLVWSAGCDITAGYISDRLSARGKSVKGIIQAMALVSAIAFAASFAVSSSHDDWLWLAACAFLFRTTYSAFDVPHNALLARLVDAGADTMRLASARLGLNMIATLIVTCASPWLLAPDIESARTSFAWAAIALSLLSGLAILGGIPAIPNVARSPSPDLAGRDGRRLPMATIFAVAALGAMLVSILFKAVFYFADYTLGAPDWAPQALMLATIGKLVGAGAWGALARGAIGPLNANRYACLATLVATALLAMCGRESWVMDVSIVLLGIALSGTVIAPWAALSQRVASEQQAGAAWFGVFTALTKIGVGISGWLLAMLLSLLRLVPGQAADAWQGNVLLLACAGILAAGAGIGYLLLTPRRSRLARAH